MTLEDGDYRLSTRIEDASGKPYMNIWAFKHEGTSFSAVTLKDAFLETVWPTIDDLIHINSGLVWIKVENLGDPMDYFESALTGLNGIWTGDVRAKWDALSFRINRPDQRVRNGRKSIGPLAEAAIDSNVVTTAMQTVINAFLAVWPFGISDPTSGDAYHLCIPKTVKVEPLGKKPYYVWDELIVSNSISFNGLSHQVSRD